jgi:hypothetical protein
MSGHTRTESQMSGHTCTESQMPGIPTRTPCSMSKTSARSSVLAEAGAITGLWRLWSGSAVELVPVPGVAPRRRGHWRLAAGRWDSREQSRCQSHNIPTLDAVGRGWQRADVANRSKLMTNLANDH